MLLVRPERRVGLLPVRLRVSGRLVVLHAVSVPVIDVLSVGQLDRRRVPRWLGLCLQRHVCCDGVRCGLVLRRIWSECRFGCVPGRLRVPGGLVVCDTCAVQLDDVLCGG